MASSANNIPSVLSSSNPSSPSNQNGLTTAEWFRQPTHSSAISVKISRPAMAPAQPRATIYTPPNTRGSRKLSLVIALRRERVRFTDSNLFVDCIINELQEAFEAQSQINHAGTTITDEEQLKDRKVECVKAGLYALRSIHTAWLKYPAVGSSLDGALVNFVDFRFTAMNAAAEKPQDQLAEQYARIMADAVDPPQDDIESAFHAKLRVNNCFLAVKKQIMTLFLQLQHEQLSEYLFDDDVLSKDEASPMTYNIQSSTVLHPPSTAAHLMSARGLMEAAEDEEDGSLYVFVTGGVLKSKAEKRADLAVQMAKAKKAEADEATRAKAKVSALKASIVAKSKGKARKSDIPPVEGEDDEEDENWIESPVKKATAKKAVPSQLNGGKKQAALLVAENMQDRKDDVEPLGQPVPKAKTRSRKRSVPATDADNDDNADDTMSTPAPKKRAKSMTTSKKAPSEDSSDKPTSSNISSRMPPTGTVAPKIAKRGGAAPKWLQDEDDIVKQMIVDHPDWPMPQIYREYCIRVANTPYQRAGQATIEYRADFVEFPKGIFEGDKERRKYDISWRTYESVRQHVERFKANVSNPNTSPPYTWEPAQANIAAGQPKRTPPPRPNFFNDAGRTPVPPIDPLALLASASEIVTPTAPPTVAPTAPAGNKKLSGWNAVNQPAKFIAYVPKQSGADLDRSKPLPAAEGSAPGDDLVEDLEDFVAQQSASPSLSGEQQGGDKEILHD